ncbi:hypothetical protein B0T17DRAFT_505303 [Bombardia bombarda]|uniref:Uncharacterized protein n=1 Tax=Bombardia bombarda TaxID=252184 RepID=A0AA39X7D4_9PEZI|nr:hypothetical protein B0T17DRAFT_505303 [Bombardia bombarda]
MYLARHLQLFVVLASLLGLSLGHQWGPAPFPRGSAESGMSVSNRWRDPNWKNLGVWRGGGMVHYRIFSVDSDPSAAVWLEVGEGKEMHVRRAGIHVRVWNIITRELDQAECGHSGNNVECMAEDGCGSAPSKGANRLLSIRGKNRAQVPQRQVPQRQVPQSIPRSSPPSPLHTEVHSGVFKKVPDRPRSFSLISLTSGPGVLRAGRRPTQSHSQQI